MKEKNINEIKIKITDRFPVEDKFDFDEELTVFLRGEIVSKQIKNNQDNTVDLILHFKALDYEIKRKR